MMIQKILRYAEKMGLDSEELLQMTVLEAMLKIEDAKEMWKQLSR
jgi:hypothetical protein